jgi:hypothetical protein
VHPTRPGHRDHVTPDAPGWRTKALLSAVFTLGGSKPFLGIMKAPPARRVEAPSLARRGAGGEILQPLSRREGAAQAYGEGDTPSRRSRDPSTLIPAAGASRCGEEVVAQGLPPAGISAPPNYGAASTFTPARIRAQSTQGRRGSPPDRPRSVRDREAPSSHARPRVAPVRTPRNATALPQWRAAQPLRGLLHTIGTPTSAVLGRAVPC